MGLFGEAVRSSVSLLFSGSAYLWQIIALTMQVSLLGLAIAVVLGMPLGVVAALGRFRGREPLVTLIQTGFALPPVVVGLFVYLLLARTGPLGGLDLLFTPTAMVIAQAILATPFVAGITLAAVRAVPPDVPLQARALGVSRGRALLTHLREARYGLVSAVVAGFGAVMSEVGAVMMVGGNVEGQTRVMTTAIVLETRQGHFGFALALGVLLLLIALAVNVLLARVQRGSGDVSRSARPWS